MTRDDSPPVVGHAGRTGAIGTLIAAYAYADAYVLGPIVVVLAALVNPLIVFVVTAVVVTLLNVVCCRWIDRQWDVWIVGHAKRFEARLEKLRAGRVMRHPVAWIERGSDVWFALAAALFNAVTVVVIARLISGQPVGPRRIRLAALGYGILFAGLFSLIGFAGGDAIRAL